MSFPISAPEPLYKPLTIQSFEVFIDGRDISTRHKVDAAYYKTADGWITFKDASNKVVYDFPEARVQLIRRIDPPK